jgi:hypothetical protein
MSEQSCSTCRFWSPTEAGVQFGADGPVVGRCDPAGSDDAWCPEIATWPAVALSWDGDSKGDTGAILLTNATFRCAAWSARGDGHGE